MNKSYKLTIKAIALLGIVGPLSSCGGGGGSGGTTPVTPLSFANGEAAVVVVGQANFTSNAPAGGASGLNSPYSNVHVSGGKLYISDYGNNRVLVFNSIPTVDGTSADYALGQPDPQPLFRWLIENPDDAGARLLLAETYIDEGTFAAAVAQYEMLLEDGSDDPVLYNNLAWSYLQLGDIRARAQAEYAYELAPNDGNVVDTLGWILVSEGDLEMGSLLLRDAHILRPGAPEIVYHLAFALSRTGARDEAIALLEGISERENGTIRESARELLSVLKQAP